MALPPLLRHLRLPVVAAPLFIISVPQLVIAQCKAGIVGSTPALNARPAELLDEWLAEITETLAAHDRTHPEAPAAPFAVNLIVHKSNDRLEHDTALCEKYKVPLVITSLGARPEINQAVHAWGGLVLHDVINNRFAHKAVEKGADGLIAVAAGAGGHAGTTSPFALVQEIRAWFEGPLALSGAIATGHAVLATQAMGGRPGLHRLGLHRHRRSACRRGLQTHDRREHERRHRVLEPLHRRARQLPQALHPRRGRSTRRHCPRATPTP